MTYSLFISHKHTDSQIARVVADFIETKSLGQVVAHVSSDPVYKGPRFGKNLNQELCRALLDTQVATDPESPRTNIIVFQCAAD